MCHGIPRDFRNVFFRGVLLENKSCHVTGFHLFPASQGFADRGEVGYAERTCVKNHLSRQPIGHNSGTRRTRGGDDLSENNIATR